MKKLSIKQLESKIKKILSERSVWEEHWQDVADFIFTRKDQITTTRTPGEKKAFRLLDNTGMFANEMLASALHGMLTNPDTLWMGLTTGSPELDGEDEVMEWLHKVARSMHFVLNQSNFQTEIHEYYLDLTAFGTANMLMQEDSKQVVRFMTRFIRDYCIEENHLGVVDRIFYTYKASARDIVAEFGEDKAHKKLLECVKKNDDTKFTCVHAVYPAYLSGNTGTKIISQYYVRELEHELSVKSFNELPYVVSRWTKAAGETYGRSPGMTALPEMKVLNKMNETMLIGAQKLVDPPVQMPDDGFVMPVITTPGGINYYRSGSNERIEAIFNDTRIDFGYQAMEDRRKRVRDAFFVDFLRLQQGGPMMTATEVLQRAEESARLLGPVLGRQKSEFLSPMIDRLFGIMDRRGLIPLPPVALQGRVVAPKYTSLIATAQRVNDAQSILRAISAITPFIQLDPGVAMNLDGDEATRIIVNTYGAPQEILRTRKEVAAIREQQQMAQAEAQSQQQQREQNSSALDAAKAMEILGKVQQPS